jgi:hypothetical protein
MWVLPRLFILLCRMTGRRRERGGVREKEREREKDLV